MDALKKVISSKKAELGGRRWVRQAELRAVREREAEAAYGRKKRRVAEEETDEPEASSPQEPPPEEGAVREEAPEEKDDDDEFRLTGAYAIRNTFLGGDDEARRPGQRDDDDDVEEKWSGMDGRQGARDVSGVLHERETHVRGVVAGGAVGGCVAAVHERGDEPV
mmetsp:Transcript_13037/g.39402  ORF Transcript_13037/g.39402 Transcript_13037/m.39402 type:complete len:165 (+) Transcript_13037:92-586(+)